MRPKSSLPKRKPRPEELNAHQKTVKSHGKEYELVVTDKMADDGVMESHLDYIPRYAPKGVKTRGAYNMGMCLPGCKCPYHKKRRK